MSDPNPFNAEGSSINTLKYGHDGHAENRLNCVALRHGWSRNFSIPEDELDSLDYDTLETVLEVNTLKLRPVGVRIFVENPPESGNWSKIRPWRDDGSLQSVLVKEFFASRHRDNILTRLEVRDGAYRMAEGDALSLRSVGSRIFHPRERSEAAKPARPPSRRRSIAGWLGLAKPSKPSPEPREDQTPEEQPELSETPQKPSFFSLLRPSPPVQPSHVRRSIFDFFRARPEPEPAAPEPDPEVQKQVEEEILRKRGWMPPGLSKKSRSFLRQRDSNGDSPKNPFLGTSKSILRNRKKQNRDPFADEPAAEQASIDMDAAGAEELSQQDVDDFFEVERPDSMAMMDTQANGRDGKNWSRFRTKDKKSSKKQKSKLGKGAEIVAQPKDAFPSSPHEQPDPSEID
ncbi:hypothetical protein C8J56DRAFT_927227 [Mycena floridula]|nr:hypothetical protein C8J56DRAFT_927227 [Mycena floridula]